MESSIGRPTRREFVRFAAVGAAALAAFPRLGGQEKGEAPASGFDLLRPGGPLVLASDRGYPMVEDALTGSPMAPARLEQGTGRWSRSGLRVDTGEALLSDPFLPLPGNRSTYARVDFAFDSPDSTIELRLVTTRLPVQGRHLSPLRARLSGGTFVLLGLGNDLIAGDPQRRLFRPAPGSWHTLELLTFQKSIHARISGCATELRLPDKMRFIPGEPGVRIAPAANSGATVRNWLVTAVGPGTPLLGAMGDSITAGASVGPEAEDYVHLVTRGLGQEYILNAGSGGATTVQDGARFRYEITPFRPRLVWIESGTNDLSAGFDAPQIFATQLATAAQITWRGRAVLSTVPPRNAFGPDARAKRLRLNELIRQSGLPFVDRARVCETPGQIGLFRPDFDSGDGTHPNARGAAAIAAAALPVFRQLLS